MASKIEQWPQTLASLQQWRPRTHFVAAVDTVTDCNPVEFYSPRGQWLRDAWLAARFAEAVAAREVRLTPPPLTKPDFEVVLRNGHVVSVEATEADLPGRRRGDEYKKWAAEGYPVRTDPIENWVERRAAIPLALQRAAERKARIAYPSGTSLLIYLNLGTYGSWRGDVECNLATWTKPASRAFRSVWVYWSGRLYSCWPHPSIRSISGQ